MKSKFKAVNWFVTTIKVGSSIPATGTSGSFDVTSKSVNGETLADGEYYMYCVIKGEDSTAREIFRIWKVSGNTVYYDRRKSPAGAFLHAAGESVQINDVAEAVNLAFEMIDDFGKVDDDGGLQVKVSGGAVQIGTSTYAVASTTIVLADNVSGQFVVFDMVDQLFKNVPSISGSQVAMAQVTTLGGDITSLTDKRPALFQSLANVSGNSVAVTTYGAAKVDGILDTYARSDHTHGSPAVPTATQLEGTMDDAFRAIKNGAWTAIPGAGSEAGTPAPAGSTVSDETTFWRLTYAGGNYDDFKTDGIYHYDSAGFLIAVDAKTGTYSAAGMAYTDGTTFGSDGVLTTTTANYAYRDQPNVFTGTNQFESGTLFKKTVYGELKVATSTVDFSQGNVQKIAIAAPTALTFENLAPGTVFGLFIVSSGTAAISGITCTDVAGGALTTDTIGGTLPDITDAGGYILSVYVGETAAHVFVNGPTASV